jgi:TonB family protein
MMKNLSKIVITFLFLSSTFCFANEEPTNEQIKARFQTALTAYDSHTKTYPDKEIVALAKELYQAGTEYYSKDDINLGVLAYYYASALNKNIPSEEVIPLLEQAITIYKSTDEVPQQQLINSYIELGKFYYKHFNKRIKGKSYFNKAINVAEKNNDKLQIAATKLDIGKIYLSYGAQTKNMTNKAKQYIEYSYTVYKDADLPKQLEASFWAGKANLFAKKEEVAADFFEKTIHSASDKQVEQQYSMISHAFLVDVYSKLGEDDKATEHCQAIGRNQVWDDTEEPKPLYVLQPKYPRSAALKGIDGVVTMEFTIDTDGFAKNINVAKSEGGKRFEEASINAIKKWRFAPKFENGHPVEADVKYTMEYKIES